MHATQVHHGKKNRLRMPSNKIGRYFDRKTDYQTLKQKNIFRSCTMINNMYKLIVVRGNC